MYSASSQASAAGVIKKSIFDDESSDSDYMSKIKKKSVVHNLKLKYKKPLFSDDDDGGCPQHKH